MFRVELIYFKDTGKYYSEGEYTTHQDALFQIFKEVRVLLRIGKLPGLIDGCSDFHVLVGVPDHPHDHPALILNDRLLMAGIPEPDFPF